MIDTTTEISQVLVDGVSVPVASGPEVLQTTGTSTTGTMSQNAITQELNKKLDTTGGSISGSLDFTNSNAWVFPYLLGFKNSNLNVTPDYPITGFYQWGDEWQVVKRNASNAYAGTLFSINNLTNVAQFTATPQVNGVNVALKSDVDSISTNVSTLFQETSVNEQAINSTQQTLHDVAVSKMNLTPDYDSGWLYGEKDKLYTITHNLNTQNVFIICEITNQTMTVGSKNYPTTQVVCQLFGQIDGTGNQYTQGVRDIKRTLNNITFATAKNYLGSGYCGGGDSYEFTSGYWRVKIWGLGE